MNVLQPVCDPASSFSERISLLRQFFYVGLDLLKHHKSLFLKHASYRDALFIGVTGDATQIEAELADPRNSHTEPEYLALQNKRDRAHTYMRWLHKLGANVDAEQSGALLWVVWNNAPRTAAVLVSELGAETNVTFYNQTTPRDVMRPKGDAAEKVRAILTRGRTRPMPYAFPLFVCAC